VFPPSIHFQPLECTSNWSMIRWIWAVYQCISAIVALHIFQSDPLASRVWQISRHIMHQLSKSRSGTWMIAHGHYGAHVFRRSDCLPIACTLVTPLQVWPPVFSCELPLRCIITRRSLFGQGTSELTWRRSCKIGVTVSSTSFKSKLNPYCINRAQ
jgi:hypothetical protein